MSSKKLGNLFFLPYQMNLLIFQNPYEFFSLLIFDGFEKEIQNFQKRSERYGFFIYFCNKIPCHIQEFFGCLN